jgi:hypothetical protein
MSFFKALFKDNATASLRYPLATLTEESDYLLMEVIEYKPSNLEGGALERALENGVGNQSPKRKASIILPIPTNITAANGVSWNSASLNELEEIAGQGLMNLMQSENFDQAGAAIREVGSRMQGIGFENGRTLTLNAITKRILQNFGSQVTLAQSLARTTGQVLNPNMELLFSGPGLRSFSFSYQLSARNENEGRQIKEILRVLKKSMAPKRAANELFICTPDIFSLKFKRGASDHQYLNRFKQMALTDMSVNYTGSGTYTVYDNGMPTLINISMTFQELAPVYAQDYDKGEGTIGMGY